MRRGLLALLLILLPTVSQAGETLAFGRGSYAELVARHAGRPLVVHFWSLTCTPCLAELPHWAGWAKRLGFDLVLVSTDSIEQAPALEARLKRAGLAGFPSHAFADDFTERLMFEVAPDWRGELPRTHLIPTRGGQPRAITGSVDEKSLRDGLR